MLLFMENLFSLWKAFLLGRFQPQQPALFCSSSALIRNTAQQVGASFFANTSTEEDFTRPIREGCNPGVCYSKLQSP